ncbi:hypothetical protein PV728_43130 [Streptomyces europaeiscabiei]|nr:MULTISPECIES: hypothetical protein [Streptomyces]MDX3587348.1 hypothetical protein [Streptomyces europaeiscabiei]MDX3613950.1 hypothetical protein [Streptomyces europaeiscabiei]MDX3636885.1 hypothetical protein [Streptomyces europaeiscabiei]MDX3655110.1 hypothetical protein [Streptomyces europaeiscabiei]WUD37973.1 hypothetical protein OG858_45620 [Streptomyces europaeiscabiei]
MLNDEGQCRVVAASGRRGVLGHQRRGPGLFRSGSEALEQAQEHQQDGAPHTGRVVGGQQSDGEGRAAHQRDGHHQHGLTTVSVSERAEEEPAERAGEEADRVGGDDGDDPTAGPSPGKKRCLNTRAEAVP